MVTKSNTVCICNWDIISNLLICVLSSSWVATNYRVFETLNCDIAGNCENSIRNRFTALDTPFLNISVALVTTDHSWPLHIQRIFIEYIYIYIYIHYICQIAQKLDIMTDPYLNKLRNDNITTTGYELAFWNLALYIYQPCLAAFATFCHVLPFWLYRLLAWDKHLNQYVG